MLQNLQIRSKLVALLILPLLALTVFASSQVVTTVRSSAEAGRVAAISQFAEDLVHLADALQRERALTMGYVASNRTAYYGTMISDRVLVNEQRQTFDAHIVNIDLREYSARFRGNLNAVRAGLKRLFETERTRFENERVTLDAVTATYDAIIRPLLASQIEIGARTSNTELFRNAAAFMAISRAKQAAANEEGILFAVLTAMHFDPAGNGRQYSELQAAFGEERAWINQFKATASDAQLAEFDETVAGPDISRVNQILSQALLSGDERSDLGAHILLDGRRGIRPEDWLFPASAKIDLLRTVELQLAGDVGALSTSLKAGAQRRATGAIIVVVLVLALTIGASLLVARSMVRPLQLLEETALDVADRQLPGLVERIQHAGEVDLDAAAEPLPLRSRDEIGRVAAAFNSVHRVAIRTATEQAALRRSIGDMFINLARRSQALINRQLNLIDTMEREEEDRGELTRLFQLDHLATRMRRNAENLIVLATAEPAQGQSEPTPLSIVIHAAISEVEDYSRVALLRPGDLNVVDLLTPGDIEVVGHAVNDIVHLLAELIENATIFSPPETRVMVTTQPVSSAYLVQIEDRGQGMTDQELADANERLANPPLVDFALSRKLGFYVVGRLAARHGIQVQLRRSFYDGLVALVLIPPSLLVPSGAHASWPFAPAADTPQAEAAAPPLPAPFVPTPPLPTPSSPPQQAPQPVGVAAAGLPRRTLGASLAPGLAPGLAAGEPPGGQSRRVRSPEEIRAMLSAYHDGLRHGRVDGARECTRSADESPAQQT
jgi:hypothetical protein